MNSKQLWVLVGGNGAGKSTFYRVALAPKMVPFVNADLIAKEVFPENPEENSYAAAKIAEALRYRYLNDGISFCFETVFSHPSKIDFLADAKLKGYQVILVLIHVDQVSLNSARVSQRVAEGGHFVPDDKISQRIPRVLENVAKAVGLCDEVRILDNSSAEQPFLPMVTIRNGRVVMHCDKVPPWVRVALNGNIDQVARQTLSFRARKDGADGETVLV